eukprot:3293914-Rhodomonas_salina.1
MQCWDVNSKTRKQCKTWLSGAFGCDRANRNSNSGRNSYPGWNSSHARTLHTKPELRYTV